MPLFSQHRWYKPSTSYIWAVTWENQQCGFWQGLTQTRLHSHWRWLEAWNFVCRKKRYCTIQVAKTKALISFAVTAKLICVFVFAYEKRWFSRELSFLASNFLLWLCSSVCIGPDWKTWRQGFSWSGSIRTVDPSWGSFSRCKCFHFDEHD